MYASVEDSNIGAGQLIGVNTVGIPTRNGTVKPKLETLSYDEILKSMKDEITQDKIINTEETLIIDSTKVIERYKELKAEVQKLQPEIAENEKVIANAEKKYTNVTEAISELSKVVNELPNITPIARTEFLDNIDNFLRTTKNAMESFLSKQRGELASLHAQNTNYLTKIGKITGMLTIGLREMLNEEEKEKLVNGKYCSICTVNNFNQVLDCGHVLCSECLPKIGNKCYMCRKPYKNAIKLYLPSGEDSEIIPPVPTVAIQPWSDGFEQM